jgi:RNA polymerase sigma-70 factor (ECF subfamily)
MIAATMTIHLASEPDEDSHLIARLARGDADSFAILVNRFKDPVARLAHRLLGWNGDVDDIVQEVFLSVLQKAPRFHGHCSLWTWLTVITLNRCRTWHRRQRVWTRVKQTLAGRRGAESEPVDRVPIGEETASQIRAAVAALPPTDREAVVLFYLEHRPALEIGQLIGISPNAVEVRLHRARGKLRVSLRHLIEDEL